MPGRQVTAPSLCLSSRLPLAVTGVWGEHALSRGCCKVLVPARRQLLGRCWAVALPKWVPAGLCCWRGTTGLGTLCGVPAAAARPLLAGSGGGEGARRDRAILGTPRGFGTFPSCVPGLRAPCDRGFCKLLRFLLSLFKTKAVSLNGADSTSRLRLKRSPATSRPRASTGGRCCNRGVSSAEMVLGG